MTVSSLVPVAFPVYLVGLSNPVAFPLLSPCLNLSFIGKGTAAMTVEATNISESVINRITIIGLRNDKRKAA